MSFKKDMYELLYSVIDINGLNHIHKECIELFSHLRFLIISYIVSYSIQYSEKDIFDIEEVQDIVYTFFNYSNAKTILEFIQKYQKMNLIYKNLILNTRDTASIISSLTKRPFTLNYVVMITYLVQYIFYEIMSQCSLMKVKIIKEIDVMKCIHKDDDLYNIIYNVLQINFIPKTNQYIISKDLCKKWLFFICRKNKYTAKKDLVEFITDYINYKISLVIKRIRKENKNKKITSNVMNKYVYLL